MGLSCDRLFAELERAYPMTKGVRGLSPAKTVATSAKVPRARQKNGSKIAKRKTFKFFSDFLKFFLIYEEILNFLSIRLKQRTKQRTLLYAYAFPPNAFPPFRNSNIPAPS
jgi:hypothetical protein